MEKHILEARQAGRARRPNVGPLHEKLLQLLGRLKFRTSYSQNVLQHIARGRVPVRPDGRASSGSNGQLARRCGLLHDIGKAADHEMEGGHPKIGAELAKRYGETSKEVLHAIAGHHDDVTVDHIYTVLVAAADAISASRARRPPRDAGEVRQAAGGAGGAGLRLPRRRARLRHPGRPRGARDRQRQPARPTPRPSRSAATSPGRSSSSSTTPARSR